MAKRLTENEYLLATELANDWSKDAKSLQHQPTIKDNIEARAKAFDQAYKAIIKTVQGEDEATESEVTQY